jgi:hypothetical protein
MKSTNQITSKSEITQKLTELTTLRDISVQMLNIITNLRLKMRVDLSPQCTELGSSAGIAVDCRDKYIDNTIIKLAKFINAITAMICAINPESDGNMLNSEAKKLNNTDINK